MSVVEARPSSSPIHLTKQATNRRRQCDLTDDNMIVFAQGGSLRATGERRQFNCPCQTRGGRYTLPSAPRPLRILFTIRQRSLLRQSRWSVADEANAGGSARSGDGRLRSWSAVERPPSMLAGTSSIRDCGHFVRGEVRCGCLELLGDPVPVAKISDGS